MRLSDSLWEACWIPRCRRTQADVFTVRFGKAVKEQKGAEHTKLAGATMGSTKVIRLADSSALLLRLTLPTGIRNFGGSQQEAAQFVGLSFAWKLVIFNMLC